MANKFLKFEYWNTCDLGNIYYQGGQHFWFYLDGDVLEPFHEDTEEGQENGGGDFIPTLRRQMKRYRIKTGLVPDYLIDAMQRMKLHDHIELTFKTGEVEQVYNLDIEPEWQFEKYCWQGTVTMVFDMDEKVVLGACCDNLTIDAEPAPPGPVDLGGYYVSTTGNDGNAGTFAAPWATWQYGFSQLAAGDTLYIRGGTYQPIGTSAGIPFATEYWGGVAIINTDGTAAARITVSNYPGETPILDGSNITAATGSVGSRFNLIMRNCEYWTIKGLTFTGCVQLAGELGVGSVRLMEDCNHNILERIVSHHNGGSGITLVYDCTDNLILNCDSYYNVDPLSASPYDNSDGIEIAEISAGMTNTVRGCRMWNNCDDGVDLYDNEGIVIIENCWSFNNSKPLLSNLSNGFKLGRTDNTHGLVRRVLHNCIAYGNQESGFTLGGDAYCDIEIYNCFAGANLYGFQYYLTTPADIGTITMRNCAAYGNTDDFRSHYAAIVHDHNCYDVDFGAGPVCSAADYISVDSTQLLQARQADGSLPVLTFLHLITGSDLIYQGAYVGATDDGDGDPWHIPPSIGPFEY